MEQNDLVMPSYVSHDLFWQDFQAGLDLVIELFEQVRVLVRIIIMAVISNTAAVDGPSTGSYQPRIPNSFISLSDQVNIGNGCASVLKTKRSSGTGSLSRQSR